MYRLSGESRQRSSVKIWLVIGILLPVIAWSQEEEVEEVPAGMPLDGTPAGAEELPPNWVDRSHTVASDSAQAVVEWMDEFFGDPTYDLEKAESFLRLEFEHEWDQEKGNDFGIRLRGKVQLPKINQRVDLIFSDDDTAAGDRAEQSDLDRVALQVNVRESTRSRFDATLGWSSGAPKPGVRFRNEGDLTERDSYRYVQRVQWANDEGFFTLGQVDLFHALDSDDVVRWSNRIKWGEETDGVEWRTRLSLFQRFYEETERPWPSTTSSPFGGRPAPNPTYRITPSALSSVGRFTGISCSSRSSPQPTTASPATARTGNWPGSLSSAWKFTWPGTW